MNDEIIWRTYVPSTVKMCVWFGAIISFLCSILYFVVFCGGIYALVKLSTNPTLIAEQLAAIGLPPDLTVKPFQQALIVSSIGFVAQYFLGYSIYKSRKLYAAVIIMIIYSVLCVKFNLLSYKLVPEAFALIMLSCLASIWGSIRFIMLKKAYVKENKPQNPDPYGLHSSYAVTAASKHYTPPAIAPIKVDFNFPEDTPEEIKETDEADKPAETTKSKQHKYF